MRNQKAPSDFLRYILGGLLLLVAVNATGGGIYGLSGAKDIPPEWLSGSPFRNYFIPSLFLLLVVGGSSLFAGIMVLRRNKMAYYAALFCGILILLWLIVQVAIIGYVSWMQPATATAAILIILLTWQLPAYEH